jgi:hypothetical protein
MFRGRLIGRLREGRGDSVATYENETRTYPPASLYVSEYSQSESTPLLESVGSTITRLVAPLPAILAGSGVALSEAEGPGEGLGNGPQTGKLRVRGARRPLADEDVRGTAGEDACATNLAKSAGQKGNTGDTPGDRHRVAPHASPKPIARPSRSFSLSVAAPRRPWLRMTRSYLLAAGYDHAAGGDRSRLGNVGWADLATRRASRKLSRLRLSIPLALL